MRRHGGGLVKGRTSWRLSEPGGGGGDRRCGLPRGPLLRPRRPWTSHFAEHTPVCQSR